MAQAWNRHFLKEDKNMAKRTNDHQRNGYQHYNEIPFHIYQNGNNNNNKAASIGEDVKTVKLHCCLQTQNSSVTVENRFTVPQRHRINLKS